MKSPLLRSCVIVAVLLAAASAVPSIAKQGKGNPNPGILPINSNAGGKSYGEWVAAWWTWAISIPAAQNPILDTTGEFGLIGQGGSVYFLAGNFGGTDERTLTIPPGKKLFFPLFNAVWWAPDDLDDAAFIAALFGLNPALMTDEELIAFIAAVSISEFDYMTLTIDGKETRDLETYRATSPTFPLIDTDFIDTMENGPEISHPNFAIGDGYWVLLNPLPPGKHTIRLTVGHSGPVFPAATHDVTYHLTVER